MQFTPLPEEQLASPGWTPAELENVHTVMTGYGLLTSGGLSIGDVEVTRLYDPAYSDHATTVAGGDLAALVGFVSGFQETFPDGAIHVEQVLADGRFVFVHTRARRTPDQPWDIVMEVFRLEGDRMIEHWEAIEPWDLMQPADSTAPAGAAS